MCHKKFVAESIYSTQVFKLFQLHYLYARVMTNGPGYGYLLTLQSPRIITVLGGPQFNRPTKAIVKKHCKMFSFFIISADIYGGTKSTIATQIGHRT